MLISGAMSDDYPQRLHRDESHRPVSFGSFGGEKYFTSTGSFASAYSY